MAAVSNEWVIAPRGAIGGRARMPGDKSVSHRAAMFSALARGESRIRGYLRCEDCLNTLRAMEAMGAGVVDDGVEIRVTGTGGRLRRPAGVLDMGNSGTGMRLTAGLVAGQRFTAELTGDESLRSRPMERIRRPLELMGARVELLGPRGCAPVRVTGGDLQAIDYSLPVASAQVKACVLLAGMFASGTTTVREPHATRDHTERMMKALGLPLTVEGPAVSVSGCGAGAPPRVEPREWQIPGDFSSAAFWLAAGAARPGAEVVLENVGLNPRRTAFLDVLRRMGASIEVQAASGASAEWEPVGTVIVRGARLHGARVAGEEIANVIDELPVTAAMAALADGETVIADAAELRVKESDRIAAMAAGLRAMGVPVEERPDGMVVSGGARIRGGATVDSLGDHRIAMALAVLALSADSPVRVRNTACVATSYPEFGEHLAALAR